MSELMTVAQVAKILKVNEVTVTRRFSKVEGVLDLGTPESPKKRRYRVLRIPKSVVEKYLATKGSRVSIEVPTITNAPRRADWENKAAQDLVELTRQKGNEAVKMIETITQMATMMSMTPEKLWDRVYVLDDEEQTWNGFSDECESGQCHKCSGIILNSGLVGEVVCIHNCHRK